MAKRRYHIKPETGEPGICSAEIQCRYGDNAHYGTAKEARRAYSEIMEKGNMAHLNGLKLSRGAKILLQLDKAEADLIQYVNEHERTAQDIDIRESKIQLRNGLRRTLLEDLAWDDSDAPDYDPDEIVDFHSDSFEGDEDRFGYSNAWQEQDERTLDLLKRLDIAGSVWLKRLSTAEVKAVSLYNSDPRAYADAMAGKETDVDPREVKYLHSAVAKAPKTSEPFTVYAGISEGRVLETRAQCEEGVLDLRRVQSSSANPAQVNGFMFQSDGKANNLKGTQDETAIEFQVSSIASLSGFNINRREMEILVPPGKYDVMEKLQGVNYYWRRELDKYGKLSGRRSDYTYRVKPREDD